MSALPDSASNYRVNLFCLLFFFALMYYLHNHFPQLEYVHLAVMCLLATVIPIWLYEFFGSRVHKRPSTGLILTSRSINKQRIIIKLIGLYGTFLIILVLYRLIPLYHETPRAIEFHKAFFDFLKIITPWIIVLSPVYFWFVDPKQKDPCDGYWHAGCLLTGRFKDVNLIVLKEHALIWFIKAFFTPIMFATLVLYMKDMLSADWQNISFLTVYGFLLTLFYAVDVIYGVLGYVLTLRISDTHIQSTEPTLLGWYVCLACYYPFASIFGMNLFSYDDGFNWNVWYAFSPLQYYLCGILILACTLVYALATVAFGYRMSNLTFRGIITSGPYRFTKHPAYIGKVASWWLISLPFFSVESPAAALLNTFNLTIITLIYYIRAKTEENHLSNYPEYVAYANWINDHGIFRSLGKYFPFLKYSEEEAKRWKSVVWFKKLR